MKLNNLIKTAMFAACYNSVSVSKASVAKHTGHALLAASLVAAIVNFAKPELIKNNFTTKYKLHILVVLFAISLIYLAYANFSKIKSSFSWIKNKFVKKETPTPTPTPATETEKAEAEARAKTEKEEAEARAEAAKAAEEARVAEEAKAAEEARVAEEARAAK